jgi:hypothetical protein
MKVTVVIISFLTSTLIFTRAISFAPSEALETRLKSLSYAAVSSEQFALTSSAGIRRTEHKTDRQRRIAALTLMVYAAGDGIRR